MSTCNTLGLDVYIPSDDMPWNAIRVKHLYRRAGYGANFETIQNALSMTPSDLVDLLVDEALLKTPLPDPGWGYWDQPTILDYYGGNYIAESRQYLEYAFFDSMRNDNLFGRMTMFWSNHFVTEENLLKDPPYLYQQFLMRQTHCVGNFKDFVRAVGTDPSMLFYLNGYQNTAGTPNENYARELYELFTLGVDNGYTEDDIVETSRALTGYNTRTAVWGEVLFNANNTFDTTDKTIFGQTGNWGYDDVIDILFEQKPTLIANYICEKLYKYFVASEVNEDIVIELAQTFIDNDFEIAPVLRQLFKSEHFFSDDAIGTLIKSPIDLIIQLQNELNIYTESTDNTLNRRVSLISYYLEMAVFDPPNVAGWPGDEFWLNSVTIPERWLRIKHVLNIRKNEGLGIYAALAISMFDDVNEPADNVARGIVDLFLTKDLYYENEYEEAIATFKDGVPSTYFEDGTWDLTYFNLDTQVWNLLRYIQELPEFQLK